MFNVTEDALSNINFVTGIMELPTVAVKLEI